GSRRRDSTLLATGKRQAVPQFRERFSDLTGRNDRVVIQPRIDAQQTQNHVADDGTADRQDALVRRRKRASAGETDSAAKILGIVGSSVLLRENGVFRQLFA